MRDANKQRLAWVYYEDEPGRRSAAKLFTKDDNPNIRKFLQRDEKALERDRIDE